MNTLPKDMLLEILTNINDSEIFQLCQVDRRFYQVCNDEEFWKKRGSKTFGPLFFQLHDELKNTSFKKTYRIASDLMAVKTWLSQLKRKVMKTWSNREKRKVDVKTIMDVFHIQELDLSNNQLTVIPKEIGHLQNLQDLYLQNNQLTVIPKEIGKLRELEVLDLHNNELKEVPKELGQLRELYALDLASNQLKEVPKELGNLRKLIALYLGNNNQLISIPKEIMEIPKIYIEK